MSGLSLHAGGSRITRDELAALPVPKALGSRHVTRPFVDDVDLIDQYLSHNGFEIVEEAFGVTKDTEDKPKQFFGLLEIRQKVLEGEYVPAEEFALAVGIRGSYDQSIPRGLAVGSNVFVCSNLCFSGEIKVTTKQTLNIASRIPALLESAVGRIPDLASFQVKRFDAYKNFALSQVRGDAILTNLVRQGILNPSDLGKAIAEWDNPSHPEHIADGRSAYTLFQAVTEAYKPPLEGGRPNFHSAWNRGLPLTEFLDRGVGLTH